jgi:6-phosphofructokinase 1
VIPEEFSRPIDLEAVLRVLEGTIVKRLAAGRADGVAVISEGIAMGLDENHPLLANVPHDDHGHVRLPEVPLANVLRKAVADALASRGVKVTIGEKDVGYELRCGYPTAYDRDYTRDLGVGAVETLLGGQSGVMITRVQGRIEPLPFKEIIDPATGRSRVRIVDVASDSYRNALLLQDRITSEDLADGERLAAIARAANLSPEEARERYAPR